MIGLVHLYSPPPAASNPPAHQPHFHCSKLQLETSSELRVTRQLLRFLENKTLQKALQYKTVSVTTAPQNV